MSVICQILEKEAKKGIIRVNLFIETTKLVFYDVNYMNLGRLFGGCQNDFTERLRKFLTVEIVIIATMANQK